MNSKLRDIPEHLKNVRDVVRWSYNHGLLKGEYPDKTDIDKKLVLDTAEKAIRQAVSEEMLGLKPNNPYKTTDGQVPESFEAPAHAYDVANGDWEQKIKEWAAHQGDI